MKTNDETVYGPVSQPKKEEKKQNQGWQTVSMGGVTGILMGGAGMYAANAYGAQGETIEEVQTEEQAGVQETANGIKVAEVDQSMSFGEAFEAARQEVGAGGVFHWHGGIYNTYTAAEWNSMTPEEHSLFSQQVQPEIRKEEQHPYTSHHDAGHHHDQDYAAESQQTTSRQSAQAHETDNDDEPEVHFLGVESVQTNDGETINVGRMSVDDVDVAVVDMDNDMVFDVLVADRNQNGQIEDDEVVDISSRQMTVTDFALMAEENNGMDASQPILASNQQDNLADDMPDYMNDVDVSTI